MTRLVRPAELDRDQWLAALRLTRHPPPELHPSVVLGGDESDLHALRAGQDGGGAALLFLTHRPVSLVSAPGLDRLTRLDTLALVSDRILGPGDGESMRCCILKIALLVETAACPPVLFDTTEVDSVLWRALQACPDSARVLVHRPAVPQPHWYLDFPERGQTYWDRFSGKSRKNLRRAASQLRHEVRRVTEAAEAAELLQALARVSARSWQARRLGVQLREDERTRRRLEALAALGALRSYVLVHSGEPIAFVLGTQFEGCYFFRDTAYDTRFATWSPGRVLCLRVIEDLLAENTPRVLDFGAGDAEYKRFFGNRHVPCGPLLLVRRSLESRALLGSVAAVRAFEAGTRRAFRGTRVYRALRRLYRS